MSRKRKNSRVILGAKYNCDKGTGAGCSNLLKKSAKNAAGTERRSSGKTQIKHGLLEVEMGVEEYQQCS